jgi:hypothetical protein
MAGKSGNSPTRKLLERLQKAGCKVSMIDNLYTRNSYEAGRWVWRAVNLDTTIQIGSNILVTDMLAMSDEDFKTWVQQHHKSRLS